MLIFKEMKIICVLCMSVGAWTWVWLGMLGVTEQRGGKLRTEDPRGPL